ncbi:hypothetical protein J6590_013135 [Homalodisca vitripennis]|nr:hypothetical protein J6590_013135 [Homalodisca vitripennis]
MLENGWRSSRRQHVISVSGWRVLCREKGDCNFLVIVSEGVLEVTVKVKVTVEVGGKALTRGHYEKVQGREVGIKSCHYSEQVRRTEGIERTSITNLGDWNRESPC